jgi:hypothetical protein
MTGKILFWFAWLGELGFVTWWICSDLQLQYAEPNMYPFLAFAYLMLALILGLQPGTKKIAAIMTAIGAIPLTLMLFLVIIYTLPGGKWN